MRGWKRKKKGGRKGGVQERGQRTGEIDER